MVDGVTTSTEPAAQAGQPARPSPAQRLLDTAGALFARYGIRAVGIDRVLAEAGVARASLYSSYGSKDALVLAYLEHLDRRDRVRWQEAVAVVPGPADRGVLAQRIQLVYDGALAGSKLEHSVEPLRLGRAIAAELLGAG